MLIIKIIYILIFSIIIESEVIASETEDRTIDGISISMLKRLKSTFREVDSIGFDENALRYFDADYFYNKYVQHKKKITSIRVGTKYNFSEISKIDDDIEQILSMWYSYRLIEVLKTKKIPYVTLESLEALTPLRKTSIEKGDTVFMNDAELFYAFYVTVDDDIKDSLLFRSKYMKSPLLYICLAHLNFKNTKSEFKSEQLKFYRKLDKTEFEISMEWNDYFDRVTYSIISTIIREYEIGKQKQKEYNDSTWIKSFYETYPVNELSFFIKQIQKYHAKLDLFIKNRIVINEMLNE